jgi:hypothetical protein
MDMLKLFASHTPVWVWALLIFLITRGISAMKPGETSLGKLTIVPALPCRSLLSAVVWESTLPP